MSTTFEIHYQDKQELFLGPDLTNESDSTFEKYRNGGKPLFSAFRLYSTDVSC